MEAAFSRAPRVTLVGSMTPAFAFRAEGLSATQRRWIERFAKLDTGTGCYTVSAFLVAQIGKNYLAAGGRLISGAALLELAKAELLAAKRKIGGQVVFLEMERGNDKLAKFYADNGFYKFGSRDAVETASPSHTTNFFFSSSRLHLPKHWRLVLPFFQTLEDGLEKCAKDWRPVSAKVRRVEDFSPGFGGVPSSRSHYPVRGQLRLGFNVPGFPDIGRHFRRFSKDWKRVLAARQENSWEIAGRPICCLTFYPGSCTLKPKFGKVVPRQVPGRGSPDAPQPRKKP